ncbi:dual specificity tyrosine-phosphorylation-regulated kinase 4-like [Hippocampus comes]|uniref:dual specificity tyrosine-phosphorylation-regulated kinase 4-like n=1 Tax=Hippocampus comes TaxID=109280 RepID=UPI00094E07DF|nr:PREDICTED: dual specificity tyrosine-phosphorylation-regulated kinase 4-like [Hippocampus comes]
MTQSACSACSSACSSEADSRDLAEMEGSVVESKTGFYHIHKLLDRGTSSHVFKCKNLATAKDVALKVHKNYALFENEIEMQEIVSVLDPDKKSIVEFIETFTFNRHPCLVFELLDTNLFSMVLDKKWKTFAPNDIRPVAQQSIGVIHTDLKSDNIMLVNHSAAPFRVKLIDFGLSICTVDAPLSYGVALQPMGNRAPEVALGLPFSEAIDMWSLGCVLSFLYLGNYLFLANSNYNMLRSMIEVVGRIPDHLLTASKNTHKYFKRSDRDNDGDHPKWRLMLKPEVGEPVELEDRKAFVDLLKCLLQMDPERRITPEDALKHPFLTMSHLSQHKAASSYVTDSFDKMKFCPTSTSEKEEPERRSDSGQSLKSRNWRQRLCGFLGAKKTGAPARPPNSAAADSRPKARWRKLAQVFGTRRKPDRPPPAVGPRGPSRPDRGPELRPEKIWWHKICLFFRMNRIVPEACRIPLRQGGTPVRVRARRDRGRHSGGEKSPQDDRGGVGDDGSPRLNRSTQMHDSSHLRDGGSGGAGESTRVRRRSAGARRDPSARVGDRSPGARETPSRANDDKGSRANERRSPAKRSSPPEDATAPVAETPPARARARVKDHPPLPNKPLRARNDKLPHSDKSSRAKNDALPRADRSARVKTDEPSRVCKLRVKRDPASPASKWQVRNDAASQVGRPRARRGKSSPVCKPT